MTRHEECDCAQPIQLGTNRMIPDAAVWDAYQNPQSRSCSAFVAGNLNSPELREFIEVLLAYTSNGSRPSRADSFENSVTSRRRFIAYTRELMMGGVGT